MRSERYTFMIVPDNDGLSKRFSLSRTSTFLVAGLILFIGIMIAVIFSLSIPTYFNYSKMEQRYNEVIGERSEVLELYRDLERIKQIELVVQKALGADLSENLDNSEKLVELKSNEQIRSGYLNNIPSLLPISGIVTQEMIINNDNDIVNHYGVDIAVQKGEPIFASASGNIVFADWTPKLGNLVVIYHGEGYFTYYGHNDLIIAELYQFVKIGDVIATSGNSGISSGPHLHFEIWKDGVAIDPLLYFPALNKSNISVKN